jgi:hypothetical protein
MILGGSTNAVLHLIAIAHSVGINLTIDDFQSVSDRVPFIADLKPSGKYVMEDVYKIGGIPGLLFFPFFLALFVFVPVQLGNCGHFCILPLFCFIDPVPFRDLHSGLALFAEEQTDRREHSDCHREDAGGEPGTMGPSTWGALHDESGCYPTTGETNQVDWTPEVSRPRGIQMTMGCHVGCPHQPCLSFSVTLHSPSSDGRSVHLVDRFLRPFRPDP